MRVVRPSRCRACVRAAARAEWRGRMLESAVGCGLSRNNGLRTAAKTAKYVPQRCDKLPRNRVYFAVISRLLVTARSRAVQAIVKSARALGFVIFLTGFATRGRRAAVLRLRFVRLMDYRCGWVRRRSHRRGAIFLLFRAAVLRNLRAAVRTCDEHSAAQYDRGSPRRPASFGRVVKMADAGEEERLASHGAHLRWVKSGMQRLP
jgi:hypothetical protein